jgi:hypothetical protein
MKLTPREYDLLRILITYAGKVITHQHLLREVWGPGSLYGTHYLLCVCLHGDTVACHVRWGILLTALLVNSLHTYLVGRHRPRDS